MGSHRDLARDIEEALLGRQEEEREDRDRSERRSSGERGGRGSVLVGSTDDEDD